MAPQEDIKIEARKPYQPTENSDSLKVYFGCSIKGEQGGLEEKAMIVDTLKGLGHVVLSEIFVGQDLTNNRVDQIGPQAIYEQDIAWVNEADVMVADVTRVSLGVGLEIGWKLQQGGRVLGLCREDRYPELSNMLKGCTDPNFDLYTWSNKLDLQTILTTQLGKVKNG